MSLASKTYTGTNPSPSELDATISAILAVLNGDIDQNNLTSGSFIDVSRVANGASTKGFQCTGNIGMKPGKTLDGVDVSELQTNVQTIQETMNNSVVTNENLIIMTGGPVDNGTNLYTVFTDANPDYSTTTHTIYYAITGFSFSPLDSTDTDYTLGNISAYVSGSTVTMAGKDRKGVTIASADMKAYYLIIAVPLAT